MFSYHTGYLGCDTRLSGSFKQQHDDNSGDYSYRIRELSDTGIPRMTLIYGLLIPELTDK